MTDPAAPSPWIIETTDATFERDVIERSHELPVVVDFWAEWCQPCRALGPLLENLAREFDGKFLLVKADTEKNQMAAGSFGVSSIPAVYGLRDGQPVDFFQGLLPEEQLRDWLARLLPSPVEEITAEGKSLVASDAAAAEARFRAALELDEHAAPPKIALAELLVAQDRNEEARQLIEQLEARGFLEPEAERIKSALQIQSHAAADADWSELEAAVEQSPDDHAARLKLAEALAAAGRYEPALEHCLHLVTHDRAATGEEARKTMVDIFRLLPEDSDLTRQYRRKLSMALY